MICIYCFHGKTTISNSRGHKKTATTWRRHECPHCGRLFSSIERPVMADSYTITHSSGPSEPYSRSHLASSLQRAFAHITGSALYVTIDSLADTIENEIIQSAHDAILSSEELGAIAYETLKRYDPVAGVQYAAQNGLVSAVSQRRRGRPSIK